MRNTILALCVFACVCAPGCFEAPPAVRENSKLERELWTRYVVRTEKAIATRNAAIKQIAEGRNEEIFQRNLATGVKKYADDKGQGDVVKMQDWTLAAVEKKEEISKGIDSFISEQDRRIAEDRELVKAAMGVHDKGQEWLDTGADASAITSLFELGASVIPGLKSGPVPLLKTSDVK